MYMHTGHQTTELHIAAVFSNIHVCIYISLGVHVAGKHLHVHVQVVWAVMPVCVLRACCVTEPSVLQYLLDAHLGSLPQNCQDGNLQIDF